MALERDKYAIKEGWRFGTAYTETKIGSTSCMPGRSLAACSAEVPECLRWSREYKFPDWTGARSHWAMGMTHFHEHTVVLA